MSPVDRMKPRGFAVRRGELLDRFDVLFYASSSRIGRSLYPLSTVRQYFFVRDGDHNRLPDEEITSAEHGIRYLRAQDLREGVIGGDDPVYITRSYYESVERSHIKPGYLLFSIMGSIGNSAVVPPTFPPATANRAVGILVPKTDDSSVVWFLFYLLLTDFGSELYSRIKKGGLQQRTNLADVEGLEFPLPPEDVRAQLIRYMESARQNRQDKLNQAETLLSGFDDFVLSTLGLSSPAPVERHVFGATVGAIVRQSRLNANYFHPERMRALRAMETPSEKLHSARLMDLVTFVRDQVKTPGANYLGLAHVQAGTGELTSASEEVAGACSIYAADDVLFARLRPYLNKVYRAEAAGCCSPEFHVLRVNDLGRLLPDYLAAILRSKLTVAQTRHMMTGNTHPRLTNEDVVNLVIPVPNDIAVQRAIVEEGLRRRQEARRLKADAEADWNDAKAWLEAQLLSAGES